MEILELISAGGDMSMIALAVIMWKFDRRILVIELRIKQLFEKGGNHEKKVSI